jgi:hypothetical protein
MTRVGLAFAVCLVASADDKWPALKSVSQRVLWSGEKAQAFQPVFSGDGKRVAFFATIGSKAQVLVAPSEGGSVHVAWSDEGAKVECSQIGFSPDGHVLAALLRHEKAGRVRRGVIFGPPDGRLDWLGLEPLIYEFAFSPDGRRMAVSTRQGIVLAPLSRESKGRLLLAGEGSVERRAPYQRLRFAPDGAFAAPRGTSPFGFMCGPSLPVCQAATRVWATSATTPSVGRR